MATSNSLGRRTALVTGASSGVGSVLAKVLAADGFQVALAARRVDRLRDLVAEIGAGGGRAMAAPFDIEDEASIIAAYDMIEAEFGSVSV